MKKRIILFAVLAILIIGIGGVFLYRHFVLDKIMDWGGMENPDAVSEPEETQEIPETAELVSFHWHQNGMSYGDCFTFRIYVAGQDPPGPRLRCSYTDMETYERIEIGDELEDEACPPVSLERWAELSDFLRNAELPAYRAPDPNLLDATDSRIQVTWCDGDEQFTNCYDGTYAHDLLKLLQDIAGETYRKAEAEAELGGER